MKKIFGLVMGFLFSAVVIAAPATASVITGSVSVEEGSLTATGPWGTQSPEAMLSWNVSQTGDSWTYHYILNLPAKDNSHAIFQVSDTFTSANVLSGTTSGWELGFWGDQGNSNPGIPDLMYGLKFPGSGLADVFTIVTDRAPMWGSFYAKDGKDGGQDVYTYNSNFGGESDASIYSPAPFGLVMVPNTVTAVPEPSTWALFGLGLLTVGAVARRRKTL